MKNGDKHRQWLMLRTAQAREMQKRAILHCIIPGNASLMWYWMAQRTHHLCPFLQWQQSQRYPFCFICWWHFPTLLSSPHLYALAYNLSTINPALFCILLLASSHSIVSFPVWIFLAIYSISPLVISSPYFKQTLVLTTKIKLPLLRCPLINSGPILWHFSIYRKL